MAATGFTPISTYYTTTSGATPTAGNLVNGELALNIHTSEGKLFYKDSAGTVQVLASKATGTVAGSTTQVIYNNAGAYAGSANMTFNGTTFTLANDASISGLTVGKGGGAVGTNTVVGSGALAANTTASESTAVGYQAGYSQTTGGAGAGWNTYLGTQAGYSTTTGYYNTFSGYQSGYANSTGTFNTFYGFQSGINVTTGSKNTIIGGYNGNQGGLDIRTASNYIVLSDGDGNPRFYVNNSGYPFCVGAYTNTTANAANMYVYSSGDITRSTSSRKYKTDIVNYDKGLAEVMQLRPVTYKGINDGDKQFAGLIAEEVEEIGLTEFVQYADDGSPDALAYPHMISLLTKAIQELNTKLEAQALEIAALKVK